MSFSALTVEKLLNDCMAYSEQDGENLHKALLPNNGFKKYLYVYIKIKKNFLIRESIIKKILNLLINI